MSSIALWLPDNFYLNISPQGWCIYNHKLSLLHSFSIAKHFETLVPLSLNDKLYIFDKGRVVILTDLLHDTYTSVQYPSRVTEPYQACVYKGQPCIATNSGVWSMDQNNRFKLVAAKNSIVTGVITLADNTLVFVTQGPEKNLPMELYSIKNDKTKLILQTYEKASHLLQADPYTCFVGSSSSSRVVLPTTLTTFYYSIRNRTYYGPYQDINQHGYAVNRNIFSSITPFGAPTLSFSQKPTLIIQDTPTHLPAVSLKALGYQ